jgi:hypothetical protein
VVGNVERRHTEPKETTVFRRAEPSPPAPESSIVFQSSRSANLSAARTKFRNDR